jgi:hypothetical protein
VNFRYLALLYRSVCPARRLGWVCTGTAEGLRACWVSIKGENPSIDHMRCAENIAGFLHSVPHGVACGSPVLVLTVCRRLMTIIQYVCVVPTNLKELPCQLGTRSFETLL